MACLVLAGAGCVGGTAPTTTPVTAEPKETPVFIGLSLGTLREERWATDRDFIIERAKQLGAVVNVENANSDADKQMEQAEKLINQGVQVLIVVPHDGEKAAAIVERAHKAGVKVIAYDRLIKNSDLDLYVSFDSVKVGRMEAEAVVAVAPKGDYAYVGGAETDNNATLLKNGTMQILQPKVDSGDIKLVVDEFTPNWQPDLAYKTVKNYLATGKKLDGVIAANDGTAFGAIQALKEKGLAGKVPVSGQDAELSACQRLVDGTQTVTVYKPIRSLADQAVNLAIALAKDRAPTVNSVTNNGKIDVPSFMIDPVAVTKDNLMDTVVKDGFHSYDEIYGASR